MKPVMRDQAEIFRKLHQGPELLVLPNAWDVATARLVEEAGFPAVATTSAGVAWALGYRDRKSTRLNSSHLVISYAVFCLKKKKFIVNKCCFRLTPCDTYSHYVSAR